MKLTTYILCLPLLTLTPFFALGAENTPNCKETQNMKPIYKILRASEWRLFHEQGFYAGNADDQRDGFIHLSPEDKVERIINKYFKDERPLYIAKFSNCEFLSRLKWEEASTGDLYPHLYDSPLSLNQVENVQIEQ